MQLAHRGINGLSLLFALNADRLLVVATVVVGLLAGAWLGDLLAGHP
ncbi:MAG: hypothetical protein IAE87_13915 [Rhodobacteraceae bacterium]|jgi:asparagine N-glycosylation enzyme membrane subunit Stt3|nr:hypothetical protein [Paracoccaceae bacterium]